MISIVCVYNNKEKLENYLIKSLNKQNSNDYELVLIDNRDNKFKSAASALNYGATQIKAKSAYYMFAHQDIEITENDFFKKVEKIMNNLKNPGIIGVAGRAKHKLSIYSNINGGEILSKVGKHIDNPVIVDTVDECCFFIPENVFNKIKFDENVCDNWHLYSVDYSLSSQNKGLITYVIPIKCNHHSNSPNSDCMGGYFNSLNKLNKKHENRFIISTTCGIWLNYPNHINRAFYACYKYYSSINSFIHKMLSK